MKRSLLFVLPLLVGVWNTKAQTNIEPRAEEVLRAACQYLAQAPFFGLTAEIWREHIDTSGEKVQYTRQVELEVKRPNCLHAEIHSAYTDRGFWYSGKELAVVDRKRNFYSTTAMPATLDATLDAAHDQFGIDLPLVDLAISDPYKNAMARVRTGRYLGVSSAMGYTCHHLAFTQDNIDWQVWIEDGPQPLIRKFVITHKLEAGAPEFTGLIRGWNLQDRISDLEFAFEPPRGALKVRMLKDQPTTGPANAHQPSTNPTTPTGR